MLASPRLGVPLTRSSAQCARAKPRAVVCAAPKGAQHAGAHSPHKAPSQDQVLLHDGKQYVPLSEAQRFFEAGVRSGAPERIEMLEAQLRQVEAERDELAAVMQDEYSLHEREMKELLTVALTLESEVEKRTAALGLVAAQSAHEAEARMEEAFAAQLEVMHQQDVQEVEEHMHERFQTMGHALRTALAGKEQWRHRALEAEKQLGELRAQIQARAEGAQAQAKAGARRVQHALPRHASGAGWRLVDED